MYQGSWKIDDLLTFTANTHTAATGAATDADAVPSYHVYEDETATPIITGTMALLNGANTVGYYSEQITLSAANGFEKGKSYNIYIQAAVGGVLGTMNHHLQIEAEVDANVVSDKTGYSLSTPQTFNLIGNITGTLSNVLNVINPVVAGVVTGSVLGNVNGSVASVTNPVTAGNVTGSVLGNVNGSVASVTAPVTVGTNSDKTGYSLSTPQSFNLIGNISGTLSNVLNVINPVVAGVVTGSILGNVNGSVASVTAPVGISTGSFLLALADVVWDEDVDASHQTAGSAGKKLDDAGSAGDPWGTSLAGYSIGTAGHTLHTRMPTGSVTVSSNQDKTGYSLSSPQSFNLIGNISGTHQGDINGYVGNVTGSVGSVVAPVTVGTNNDKTGYSLSTPQAFDLIGNVSGTLSNVLNVINPVVAGVVTGSVLGNVNGSVGSVVNPVGISTGTFLDALADKVWDEQIAGHLTAGSVGSALNGAGSAGDPWTTTLPGAYGAGTAGHILASRMPTGAVLVGDKTGFSLSSPQSFNLIGNISGTLSNVVNVVNPVTAGSVTGSVGSVVNPVTVGTNNDKTGYSLSSPQSFNLIGNVSGTLSNVLNVANPVTAGVVTGSVLGGVVGSVGSVVAGVGISTGTLLDAIADKVWDETIASHLTAGSTGEKLNASASAGDPWSTALPGSYVAGSAGHILASRMPTGAVVVGTNQDKTGYSLSSPQNFNLIGNISGTLSRVIDLSNAGSTVISDADISEIASRVWESQYAPIRTLTTVVGDAIPPAAGEDVFMVRGDTFIWNISGLDLSDLSKIQFSVKKKFTDVDAASLIFVETGTGLMWIDGVAATPANGAITYVQVSGTAQIRVEAVETAKLDVDQPLYYDVQIIRTTGTIVSSPLQGTFHITWDSTRATS